MQKIKLYLVIFLSFASCGTMSADENYEDIDKVLEDFILDEESRELDTLSLQDMPDDFLVAGEPYTRFELFVLRISAYALYSVMLIKKGFTYSYDKTLRILRLRR